MKGCIKKVIREVREVGSPDFQRTLLQAALLLEKHYIPECEWRGVDSDVDDAEVSDASTEELQDVLMAFVKAHREHPNVGTAIWALGKCWGRPLREFFINEMKAHLEAKRYFPLSQAEGALFHFGGGTHYSFSLGETDYERYYEACRRFLESQAK